MRNVAAATAMLDPHVVLQMMQSRRRSRRSRRRSSQGLAGAFDDAKVAQLLATALSREGQATDRLADSLRHDRAGRGTQAARADDGADDACPKATSARRKQFKAVWSSMEELLICVQRRSRSSRSSIRRSSTAPPRAARRWPRKDLPEEMPEWVDTLGQQNVRKLSVVLIIDLLKLERGRASVRRRSRDDMTALAEDLLMAGDYAEARDVALALRDAGDRRKVRRARRVPRGAVSLGDVAGDARGRRRCSATSTPSSLESLHGHLPR